MICIIIVILRILLNIQKKKENKERNTLEVQNEKATLNNDKKILFNRNH